MSQWAKWRKNLDEIGGWDNELVSVPAGAVRKMIELGEYMENALERIRDDGNEDARDALLNVQAT